MAKIWGGGGFTTLAPFAHKLNTVKPRFWNTSKQMYSKIEVIYEEFKDFGSQQKIIL